MTLPANACAFACRGCGENWYAPPDVSCPRCGPGVFAEPDDRIWAIDAITPNIYITAQPRDAARCEQMAKVLKGGSAVLNIANDPHRRITWTPGHNFWEERGIEYVELDGLVDSKHGQFDEPALITAVEQVWSTS